MTTSSTRVIRAFQRSIAFVTTTPGLRSVVRFLLGGAFIAFAWTGNAAEPAAPNEDQVKAAFLLNFPKYVEWPAGTFADASAPIVLTIIADKAVEKEARQMAEGKLFAGRPVEIRSAAASDQIAEDCRILFIGFAEERRSPEIVAGLAGRSVLTIGECDDFFEDGGMIKLVRRDHKIHLEINLLPAKSSGLKLSSRLLSVAEVVKRRKGATP
jgi:hypothetical protein